MSNDVFEPGTGPDWTTDAPPAHELAVSMLAVAVDHCADVCRDLAHAAHLAHLRELPQQFGLTWDTFCEQRLHHTAAFVEAMLTGVDALGDDVPLPEEVAVRLRLHP